MKAKLHDQEGPPRARALPYLLVPLVFAVTLLGNMAGLWGGVWMLLTMAAPFFAGLVPTSETKKRLVTLATGPGYVDVRDAGSRAQRISARQIEGASTARAGDAYVLTLAVAKRAAPIVLELGSADDVSALRTALGIGHDGAGTISWRPAWTSAAKSPLFGRVVLALLAALFIALDSRGTVAVLAITTGQFIAIAIALVFRGIFPSLFSLGDLPLSMDASGIRVWRKGGWVSIPYALVRDVRVEPRRVVIVTPQEEVALERSSPVWDGDGLSDASAEALRVQVLGAAARAHGLAAPRPELSVRLETLRLDPTRETHRQWIARLDAMGAVLTAGAGYRGQMLDANDLWSVVEDPDADGHLRAAAARVLRSSGLPDVRVRIDAAVAATRDELTHACLRVAADYEAQRAAEELAVLDHRAAMTAMTGRR